MFQSRKSLLLYAHWVLRTWQRSQGLWTLQKPLIIIYCVFSLTLPENLGVSSGWESSGYTFDINHWKFLQPSLFCSWRRSLQSGFSAFTEEAQGQQGYYSICVRDARNENDNIGMISTTSSILHVIDIDIYFSWLHRGGGLAITL